MTAIPTPNQLFVEVTSNCNLSCPHCYIEAGVGRLRQLSFETVTSAIAEFRAMGGLRFTLSGGEPTLYKRWKNLLAAALDAGLSAEIISNGTRLLDQDIDFFVDHPVAIDISLDGARADRHEAIRGSKTFGKTIATVDRLLDKELGNRITLCFAPMRSNWEELQGIFDWAELRGIARVYVSLLEDRGRANEQEGGINLLDWQRQELIKTIVDIKSREQATILEVPNLRYFPERVIGRYAHVDSIDRTLRMTADGDLYLTAYLDAPPFQLGRYQNGNLSDAWNSAKVERAFIACKAREFLIPACRSCEIFDLCQSGSAMFAWSEQHGFYGVDNFCHAKQSYMGANLRICGDEYVAI